MKLFNLILCLLLSSANVAAEINTPHLYSLDVEITGVDATPDYSSGDLVGSKLTINNAVTEGHGGAVVVGAFVSDKENNDADFRIWLFNADPSNTTFTDNGAFTIADDDIEKVVECGPIDVSTGVSSGSGASVTYARLINCAFRLTPGTTTLYAAVEARSAINAADPDDLHLKIILSRE